MSDSDASPRGVIHLSAGEKNFRLKLHAPSPDLYGFIEHFWFVDWDLREQAPFLQEVLPHPSLHLVREPGKMGLFGVMRGRFGYRLQGRGQVFGIKFQPGGFRPFSSTAVSQFTDRRIELSMVFGAEGAGFEQRLLRLENHEQLIRHAEVFLRERAPNQRDEKLELVRTIVDRIKADRSILRVEDLAEALDVSRRNLQRLFQDYVGVGPKWVIQRYRLHEAIETLARGGRLDGPALAQQLGYCDQAHFIRDFRSIVGQTPAEYAQSARA